MRTLCLKLAYDGTDFAGWQVQPGARTVQATLEAAWQEVTGEAARLSGSGRTDAGVHALGQVASLSSATHLPPLVLQRALNARLPADLVVRQAAEAPPGFHARRDALRKRYRYLLDDGPQRDVFSRRYAWHLVVPLDADAMRRAAQSLVGRHDFASFQSSGSPRLSTVREVFSLTVERGAGEGTRRVAVEIEADGFLYHMARAIVGALVAVGQGTRPEAWLNEARLRQDRRAAPYTAPPQGLYLVEVTYGGAAARLFDPEPAG
jgi:tRNA pseudouridine38-40 synthase